MARRPLRVLAAISLVLGAAAPAAMTWLIQPVVDQLQGGLAPYGSVNIWPWIGLASSDAANTPVATLPSLAIALLMLVLGALVYVIVRLAAPRGDEEDDSLQMPAHEPPGTSDKSHGLWTGP